MATRQSTTKAAARRTPARRIPRARVQTNAATLISDQQAATLGCFCDAIGFVETACVALETDQRTTFAVPCLRLGLDLLHRAYNELDLGTVVGTFGRPRPHFGRDTRPTVGPLRRAAGSDAISYPRIDSQSKRSRRVGARLQNAAGTSSTARGKRTAGMKRRAP